MAVTASSFREHFPAFADDEVYTDDAIAFWLTLAGELHDTRRWANILDQGVELFIAHNLVLEQQAAKAAETGAVPGLASGPVASKSVDKVSISYDTSAAMEPDAGHWGLTTYGSRYLRLVRLVGMGGLQL